MAVVSPPASSTHSLEIVPLGGLGEFGMNSLVVACAGTAIVVDAGVMFPGPELPGVDLIVPDPAWLEQYDGRVAGLVLTHGHEDHIGGVPYLLPCIDGPIYGTPLTLALVRARLEAHEMRAEERLVAVSPRDTVSIGPFTIEFIRVTHSMPDCTALAIRTPAGTLVHSGDFKIDQTPLDGASFELHRFAELGTRGVLALLSDSTNIDRRGVTGSELDVVDAFEEIFSSTRGKIVVATFASSLYRMQILVNLAEQFGRKVAFVGRGVTESSQTAARLGHLRIPAGLQIAEADVARQPPAGVVCITTGSQGEPLAALPRIAVDDHRHVKLAPADTVVFSARAIPGNERAIGRVMDHVARRGADVVYEGLKHVHVSGHGSEEELKLLLSLVRPRYFVPIHGEYRQLARHARTAARVLGSDTTVVMAENGDVLQFDRGGARVTGRAAAGRILIDGTRTGQVGDQVLRDRRHIAADGLVVPVLAINGQTGRIEGDASVITRGFVMDERAQALLEEVPGLLTAALEDAPLDARTDPGVIRERVCVELQRFFRKRAGRRPLVLPVIMEI